MFVQALEPVCSGFGGHDERPMPDPSSIAQPYDPAAPGSAAGQVPAEALSSFRAVYEEHFDFVWRFAAHRGVPRAALDDVAQEVFVVVARKLHDFQGQSTLRTWIAGITRNTIRAYLRKRGNRASGEPLLDLDQVVSESLDPAQALEQKSAGELLDFILSQMSELKREAFILCELEEMPAVQAAEILDVNENTLRTRLHDARKMFTAISARIYARRIWTAPGARSKP